MRMEERGSGSATDDFRVESGPAHVAQDAIQHVSQLFERLFAFLIQRSDHAWIERDAFEAEVRQAIDENRFESLRSVCLARWDETA